MTSQDLSTRYQILMDERNAARQRARTMRFDTIAVNGIYDANEAMRNQGSVNEPLFLTSAQHYPNSEEMEAVVTGKLPGWVYTRIHNPTVYYLEEMLALMEGYGYDGDVSAFVSASGMSAVFMATNPFLTQENGDPVNFVASARSYGGSFQLFKERYERERGIELRWVRNPLDVDEWASKIDANTRFLYGEMPSNPTLAITPLREVADLAHAHGIPFIVDATVATPALMRPLQHGADIVIHSVSKSMTISGFGIMGAVVARHDIPSRVGTDEMRANFAMHTKFLPQRDFGPGVSPFNALMTINDLRTLRVRMDKLSRSAMQVAEFLHEHPNVGEVFYPGLPSHEGYEVAKQYMQLVDYEDDYDAPVNRYGHLIGFTLKEGVQATRDTMDKLKLIWHATDLGRIKSLVTIPAISTHQQQGDEGRELGSVPNNMIRLSVGGESPADLINDLAGALDG
jgi:O-acetylhomoserine/O-acetylserine sulfhydrylase-like pyridoxal-dependent enzyme